MPIVRENQDSSQSTNYLLVIGINEYNSPIPRLNNAVNDAQDFRSLLLSKYQFEEQNTYTLLNEKATKSNILKTFDALINLVRETDNLVFFYSGHGTLSRLTNRGYWLQADALDGDRATYIPNIEVIDFFNALKARHVFGIVDSCFSGALFARGAKSMAQRLYARSSRWLLTAGRLQPVADGRLGSNSPFTASLISHLRNNTAPLPVGDLCRLVTEGVTYNADEQLPRGEPLQNAGHQGGEFVFFPREMDPAASSGRPQQQSQPEVTIDELFSSVLTYTMTVQKKPYSFEFKEKDFERFKDKLKEFTISNMEAGLELLRKVMGPSNELLLLAARYFEIKESSRQAFIRPDEATVRMNRLRIAILETIDELELVDCIEEVREYFAD